MKIVGIMIGLYLAAAMYCIAVLLIWKVLFKR